MSKILNKVNDSFVDLNDDLAVKKVACECIIEISLLYLDQIRKKISAGNSLEPDEVRAADVAFVRLVGEGRYYMSNGNLEER